MESTQTYGVHNILFRGKKFRLVGDLDHGGAITDREGYAGSRGFKPALAYMKPNGEIWRFGKLIGDRKEISLEVSVQRG